MDHACFFKYDFPTTFWFYPDLTATIHLKIDEFYTVQLNCPHMLSPKEAFQQS